MPFDRRHLLGFLVSGAAFVTIVSPALAEARMEIKVYKDPSCECCAAWVKHLQAHGFAPVVEVRDDLVSLKRSLGVPDALTSCHTAIAGAYVLEGHVPAREITRLLAEKPRALGLAVPGMPIGAPGMEIAGQAAEPYAVLLFLKDGSHKVFATYP